MKRFIIILSLFFVIFSTILTGIRIVWINTYPLTFDSNFINSSTHSIVIGPSTGMSAWNDSIIPNSRNLCGTDNSLGACYNILKWATEYNMSQADTIILCASFVGFLNKNDNEVLFNLQNWNEERKNILNYKDFFQCLKSKWDYWEYILFRFPIVNLYKDVGHDGFQHSDRNELNHPLLYRKINKLLEMAGGWDGFSEHFFYSRCSFQIEFLRLIKRYCDEHKYNLVILSTPFYKIPDMIDDSGYLQLLRTELGDSVLIADYSRFEFPDTTYYADLEHLNTLGAEYFSKHIAREGLKLQYAVDYCK